MPAAAFILGTKRPIETSRRPAGSRRAYAIPSNPDIACISCVTAFAELSSLNIRAESARISSRMLFSLEAISSALWNLVSEPSCRPVSPTKMAIGACLLGNNGAAIRDLFQ